MTLGQLLLKLCGKKTEEQRMQFRLLLARAHAEAEDLQRVTENLQRSLKHLPENHRKH